ncbi:hypothetical protein PAPYR_13385 [Paratrimastix pyriformis]|nr:hypothetical protein PAPYR_13385 [Paratrimastix pyriformis]
MQVSYAFDYVDDYVAWCYPPPTNCTFRPVNLSTWDLGPPTTAIPPTFVSSGSSLFSRGSAAIAQNRTAFLELIPTRNASRPGALWMYWAPIFNQTSGVLSGGAMAAVHVMDWSKIFSWWKPEIPKETFEVWSV